MDDRQLLSLVNIFCCINQLMSDWLLCQTNLSLVFIPPWYLLVKLIKSFQIPQTEERKNERKNK